MAILTAEKDSTCRVFDAKGVELKLVVWCDTETGEAVHIVCNSDGTYPYTFDPDHRMQLVKERRQHPAPLRVERLE